MWGGGEVRSIGEAGEYRWREGASVKDRRKKQRRTWGLTTSLTTPRSCSEAADGVTQNNVRLFREPDAGNLPVRLHARGVPLPPCLRCDCGICLPGSE